eukprot:TRINITY_DN94514_c0_g1_i1.p1 TRINITY_DN94514_c0_g1~~TRINITY_DN94514_c0_g1_i1.p1  ORF type:complete len:713 (-),score=217.54 TRINITY_DN94514_c0_g1_i1:23-2128(-)
MAWFSGVLRDVQSRGSELKDKVREHARALATRPSGFGGYEDKAAGYLGAREAEARIEAEAVRLSHAAQATEVLERWLALLRTSDRRYADTAPQGEKASHLSFQQVFLRSRALELAVDTAARSPELRASLRSYALAAPTTWPDSCPPPMAFSRAFVALLLATIGPTEAWLGLLGTLLSMEKPPAAANGAEEPCHTWLVQLLAGRRLGWQAAGAQEREREVMTMEEEALRSAQSEEGAAEASSSSLAQVLRDLAHRNRAASSARRAWVARFALAEDLMRAAAGEDERKEHLSSTASCVAAAASSLASSLDTSTEGSNSSSASEELGLRTAELRERLAGFEPEGKKLQAEITALEEAQSELMKQLQHNKEHLTALRRRRDDLQKEAEQARHALKRADGTLAAKLASEDSARQQAEGSRALATAVAELAVRLKESALDEPADESLKARLKTAGSRCQQQAVSSALTAAGREVERLRFATEAAGIALALTEDAAAGQTELTQVLGQLLNELRCCLSEPPSALEQLADFLEHCSAAGHGVAGAEISEGEGRAKQLGAELRQEVATFREVRERLEVAVLALDLHASFNWEVVDGGSAAPVEPLWKSAGQQSGSDSGSLRSLLGGLASRAVNGSGAGIVGSLAQAKSAAGALPQDDPFLLEGTEELEKAETVSPPGLGDPVSGVQEEHSESKEDSEEATQQEPAAVDAK